MEKVVYATFKIVYLDNQFAELENTEDCEFSIIDKKTLLPENSQVGDIVNKMYDRETKEFSYEMVEKSPCHQVASNDFSEWVVFSLFNHTVCLYNLYDFNDKRYLSDCDLVLNSRCGDIYIEKEGKYYFDEKRNSTLANYYASLFGELQSLAKRNGEDLIEEEREEMRKFDEANTNRFNKEFNLKFINTYNIEEAEEFTEEGTIFRLFSDNDQTRRILSSKLPKFAREGDFVGMTQENEFYFDRQGQIDFDKEVEEHLKKLGGKKWTPRN